MADYENLSVSGTLTVEGGLDVNYLHVQQLAIDEIVDSNAIFQNATTATTVNNEVPIYVGNSTLATDKLIKGSGVTISSGVIAPTSGSLTLSGNVSVTGTITSSLTGNASTATKLATARTINGVSFDGSANITTADSTKLPLAGGTMTGLITTKNSSELINVATGGQPGIEIKSIDQTALSTAAAYMTFHRPNNYAVRFGLDGDNKLKVGGWSMGAVSYEILNTNNFNSVPIPANVKPFNLNFNPGTDYTLWTYGSATALMNVYDTDQFLIGASGQITWMGSGNDRGGGRIWKSSLLDPNVPGVWGTEVLLYDRMPANGTWSYNISVTQGDRIRLYTGGSGPSSGLADGQGYACIKTNKTNSSTVVSQILIWIGK